MDYYCHSCQEQTQIIAAHYLACNRCLSDFVEEIGPISDNRTTWSDEDETLASLWNSVVRQGFNDTPLPGTYPQQQEEYGNDDPTHTLFSDDNERTGTAFSNNDEEETEFHYPYSEYYQQYGENDEREEEEYNPTHADFFLFDNYHEHVNDNEEPNFSWPTDHNSDDDYQDLVSNNSSSNNRSNSDENEESSVDYFSIREIVDRDIGDDFEEYGSISSSYDNYEEYGSDLSTFLRHSFDDDLGEEERREEIVTAEEEEDSDVMGLGELLRETLIVDSDADLYPDEEGHFTTDVNEYDGPPEDYESEFDTGYELSTLLRIIREQHETTFTDPSNWEYEINRQVQSASEELIASLPRHKLNRGDTATHRDCSICLNSLGFNVELINLPCMHGFHSGCIEQWLQVNASCPVCRSPCAS